MMHASWTSELLLSKLALLVQQARSVLPHAAALFFAPLRSLSLAPCSSIAHAAGSPLPCKLTPLF